MPLRVLIVFGTRPEAIKLAPVIQALRGQPENFSVKICVTGQHRELLHSTLQTLKIAPDYDLNIMQPDQSLAQISARVLAELPRVFTKEKPGWVMVQGDTATTLAAALATSYAGLRVAHVEAGLRTNNPLHPFPEEINRRLTDHLSTLLFAPTETARRNLLREGLPANRISVTGNTSIDALLKIKDCPVNIASGPLRGLPFDTRKIILVTTHRRESVGEPLKRICAGIRRLAERNHRNIHIAFPVHLNPRVQAPVKELLGNLANVSLLPPLDYPLFVQLMRRSAFVLTDSGGIQEEAPALGIPVLLLRETTERPEGVELGCTRLVGTTSENIVSAAEGLLHNGEKLKRMAAIALPYGDGRASQRIRQTLLETSP